MSRGATVSVLGLYNNDDSLFDLMNYPDGMTDTDKDCVKNSILTECAELEVLYPNPTVMKNMIGLWSYKELFYWQRVYNASQLEYNPIENYRRHESETIQDDRTEEHSGSDTNRATGTDTSTDSGSDSLARTGTDTLTDSGNESLRKTGTDTVASSGSDTVEGSSTVEMEQGGNDRVDHNVSGYDSNLLVTSTEDETTYGKTETTGTEASNETTYGKTDTRTLNTTDSVTFGKVETRELDTLDTTDYGKVNTFVHGKTDTLTHGEKIEHDGTTERTVLAYGNIGVTTSQEMLTQEMEIAKILNVIPVIVESFKERFCLMVY